MLSDKAGWRPWARFDDLRRGGAQLFRATGEILRAESPGEVAAVIEQVDRATRRGQWAFGYLAYEAAQGLAHPRHVRGRDEGPLAWFAVAEAPRKIAVCTGGGGVGSYRVGQWRWEMSSSEHRVAVDDIRSQIASGAVYQANLTTALTAPIEGSLGALYADLAGAQRGAHNAFVDTGEHVIASASPELFFDITDRRITTRPMKGTAARGADPADDGRRMAALRASIKDRAENVMIVDLMRNDLSAIAQTGSVTVSDLCRLETYPTVHQLTSEIQANLRPTVTLTEVFGTLFPSGSITGAPKAAAMSLLDRLEQRPRGVYCGTIGFVAPPHHSQTARFNVAIRTAVVERSSMTARYGVGGGITWDSQSAAEYAEILTKTRLLRVLAESRLRRRSDERDDWHGRLVSDDLREVVELSNVE
jgi:para-aminobenzoate synthetase/4-amino-4-deoxychorismate lyase